MPLMVVHMETPSKETTVSRVCHIGDMHGSQDNLQDQMFQHLQETLHRPNGLHPDAVGHAVNSSVRSQIGYLTSRVLHKLRSKLPL